MFGFGTLALEQFEDCLIELPEFCHHISQISHLRAAKPELIQFIEHELASVSMVNSELDEGKNYITTQFPGSIRSSQSSIEVNNVSFNLPIFPRYFLNTFFYKNVMTCDHPKISLPCEYLIQNLVQVSCNIVGL